jgi:hypothetical protein
MPEYLRRVFIRAEHAASTHMPRATRSDVCEQGIVGDTVGGRLGHRRQRRRLEQLARLRVPYL